jgi:hypothetical protein
LVNGEYKKPVSIGSAINTPATETCPHIAPDESYIVFTRFDETNVKNTGIFISYKDKSGNWLPAVLAVGGDRKSGGLSPIAIKLRSRNQEVAVAVAVAVVVFPAHCYCYCHSLKQQSRLT